MSLYSFIFNIFAAIICVLSLTKDITVLNVFAVFCGITAPAAPIIGAVYRFKKEIDEKNSSTYDAFSIVLSLFTFEYSINAIFGIQSIAIGLFIYMIIVSIFLEINRRRIVIECDAPVKIQKIYKRKISVLSLLCPIVNIILFIFFIVLFIINETENDLIICLCGIIALVSPLFPIFVKYYRVNNHIISKVNNVSENISACFVYLLYYILLAFVFGIKTYAPIISILVTLISLYFHKKIEPYFDDYKIYEQAVENESSSNEKREISVSREKKIIELINLRVSDKEYDSESLFYARLNALLELYEENVISKIEYSAMVKLEIKPMIIKSLKTVISNEYEFYGESFSVEQATEFAYVNCIIGVNNLDELEDKIDKIYSNYNSKVIEKAKTSFPQIYTIYKTYYNKIMDQLASEKKVEGNLHNKESVVEEPSKVNNSFLIKEELQKEKDEIKISKKNNNEKEIIQKEKLFCRKCGTELVTDSEFCYKCGTKVIRF